MNAQTSQLIERVKLVQGCPPGVLATTVGDGDYVSMKNYRHCSIVLVVDNGATVTGCAVTLKQATDVAGTSEKALGFSTMYANTDTGASDTLVETAVTSNTFTTSTTDNKNLMYVIEIDDTDLDAASNFDCVRFDGLLMANAVGAVVYILSDPRYQDASGSMPAAITD